MTNHPSRNWRRRMRDAADVEAAKIADQRTGDPIDHMLAILIAREAYVAGYEAGRKETRR